MPRRILTGKVTSNKSNKTITVLVERKIMHPMYKKFVSKSKKFAAHDSENKFKVGDIVNIRECTPIWSDILIDSVETSYDTNAK